MLPKFYLISMSSISIRFLFATDTIMNEKNIQELFVDMTFQLRYQWKRGFQLPYRYYVNPLNIGIEYISILVRCSYCNLDPTNLLRKMYEACYEISFLCKIYIVWYQISVKCYYITALPYVDMIH